MKKKMVATLLIMVLVISLFAGCSAPQPQADVSEEPEVSEATGEGTAAPGEETTKELDIVTVVLPRDIEVLDDVHYVVAQKMGYFEQQGIEVKFEKATGTSDMQMVSVGNGDICLPHPFVALIGLTGDIPLMGVFQQDVVNTNAFCVRSDNNEINSIQDFKGKTIALGDAAWGAIVNAELIAAGLSPDDVEYVVAGENRAQMVNEGQCDIVYTWEKGYQLWLAQGMDFKVITCEDNLYITGNPLLVSKDNYENNKDVIERFLRGLSMGVYFTSCNPEAATQIVLDHFPTIKTDFDASLEVIKAAVKIMTNEETEQYGYGYSNKERWENCVKYSKLIGMITEDIAYEDIMTNEFIEAANDFDHDAVKAEAEAFQLN